MAGKKSFDLSVATAKIYEVFREKGYEGTSIADLEKATGLNRSSLYNTFGDKQKIFLQILQVHQQTIEAHHVRALKHESLRCGLKNLFESQLISLAKQRFPMGCVVSNSCANVGCYGAAIEALIGEILAQLEAAVLESAKKAQSSGELAASVDVQELAKFFAGISRAIPLLFRATGSIEYVRSVAMTALSVLNDSKTGGCL